MLARRRRTDDDV